MAATREGCGGVAKEGTYRKGVGVVLGILLPGSAHFLCGDRKAGVRWLAVLLSAQGATVLALAHPGIVSYLAGACLGLVWFALDLVMLCQSYRPVPRIGFVGWVKVLVLAFLIGHAAQMTVGQAVCTYKVVSGAMQPTLLGERVEPVAGGEARRDGFFSALFAGSRFLEIKVPADGVLSRPEPAEGNGMRLAYSVGDASFLLPRGAKPQKRAGETVKAGETLWRGRVIAGDWMFVERLTYRFAEPKRGDLVAFRTTGIAPLDQNSHYFKRVVGMPGERIKIDPPFLIVDGRKVTEPAIFRAIASGRNGYHGFQLAQGGTFLALPTDEVTLGPDEYFMLGDNTLNSFDSRYWGPVRRRNIVGKVTRVYWPFTRINALESER